ncbi:hypothetical protein L1987_29679 [Smallanthus sonchifolius]|uniref:Uncharacterized protein n=1 Tax=Smallanthus sonchifolius TaxID=185202 RepID=A0ACB9I1Y9_9ASTR|nr:hypothetical protein L1987_29679 [Smallanthus sonchifolius]
METASVTVGSSADDGGEAAEEKWMILVGKKKTMHLPQNCSRLIEKVVVSRNFTPIQHKVSALSGLNDPAVATGIFELIYEATKQPPAVEPENFDDDLVNAWATGLADDGFWGNNTPAMNREEFPFHFLQWLHGYINHLCLQIVYVNEFLSGSGTDAPDVDDENIFAKSSNDDMWAKTLLEPSEIDDDESSSSSSPGSVGSAETSASSYFGGLNYPSLFSSKSQPKIREEPTPYSSPFHKSYESFENPLGGTESEYSCHDEGRSSSGNIEFGTALYDFTAGGDDEMSLAIGEELEIEYEVNGWFYVKKVRPGWDGKTAGLVPVLYVTRS